LLSDVIYIKAIKPISNGNVFLNACVMLLQNKTFVSRYFFS